MITLPFQQQFTWRNLGYTFKTNSLDYRSILEINPQWNVMELPPIGAQIALPNPEVSGGNLQSATFISGVSSEASLDVIFPYDTETEYIDSLNRYSLSSILLREKLNGYNADNVSAITGVQ